MYISAKVLRYVANYRAEAKIGFTHSKFRTPAMNVSAYHRPHMRYSAISTYTETSCSFFRRGFDVAVATDTPKRIATAIGKKRIIAHAPWTARSIALQTALNKPDSEKEGETR